jgi:POT family proton-dependent oligopeptide transporter
MKLVLFLINGDIQMNAISNEKLRQPPVFKLAFLTTMCERFGFYALTFLLVLYAKDAYGLTDTKAFALYAIFTALVYLSVAIGGYLADNVIGIRRCLVLGLTLETLGLLLLALPTLTFFPISLALVIMGVGLFKTPPTHLMGRSYSDNDPRIDSGFTLYYMSINIAGAIIAISGGIIQKYLGWHATFLVGGIGLALGLVFYVFLKKSAASLDSKIGSKPLSIMRWISIIAGLIVMVFIISYLVWHSKMAYTIYTLASIVFLGYYLFEIFRSERAEKMRIIACLLLITIGLIFYVLYQQAFMSVVLFINRSVNRSISIFGNPIEIPTMAFYSLNNMWVIIMGPLLAMLYNRLEKKGKDFSITMKFACGLLVATLGSFALSVAVYFPNAAGLVSGWWLVLFYFFFTLGEMLVSALGVAMVTHIAPKRMYGVMMGTWWFVGMSVSAILGGLFADFSSVPDAITDPLAVLNIYGHAFLKMGCISLVFVVLAFLVAPFIQKLTQQKKVVA